MEKIQNGIVAVGLGPQRCSAWHGMLAWPICLFGPRSKNRGGFLPHRHRRLAGKIRPTGGGVPGEQAGRVADWIGGGKDGGGGTLDGLFAVGGGHRQARAGVTGGVRAVGEGVLGGVVLGVGSRRSETGWSGLSVTAQRRQERWCLVRCRSSEAVEEEEKGVLHCGVLPL
jgi:hypothetical protein